MSQPRKLTFLEKVLLSKTHTDQIGAARRRRVGAGEKRGRA